MPLLSKENKKMPSKHQRRIASTRKPNKHDAVVIYDDDDDDAPSHPAKKINICLNRLADKKKLVRETALSDMVEAFTQKFQRQFAEENFATTLYRCLDFVKKGSSRESLSASRAIGLLALTVTCKDNAHEIYEESLPRISQVLGSKKSQTELLSSVLDCLAIVTFHGANHCEETENSMQIIWDFIHPVHGSKLVAKKKSPEVLAAAISAWSFLLTTMERWLINSKIWQGAISYFTSLLEHENKSVHAAAAEALALIVELNCLKKFSSEANNFDDSSTHEEGQDSKGKLIEGVRSILVKASTEYMFDEACSEESTIEDDEANSMYNANWEDEDSLSSADFVDDSSSSSAIWDVLNDSEDSDNVETSVEVGDFTLTLNWSQLIQLNFLKRFLGDGFIEHMQKNELLHSVFEFSPNRKEVVAPYDEQDFVDREKVTLQFYLPKLRNKNGHQRVYKSPNSVYCKARSQWLKRLRVQSEARNYQSMCA